MRETAPDCCTVEATVTVSSKDVNARGRLWQDHYWGTREQVQVTDRRTSVEQVFSQLKDREGTDMSRGFVRVTGLARVTLAVGLLAVANNIRELETWGARHAVKYDERSPDHPLLQPRDEFTVLHLGADEAEDFARWRAAQKVGVAEVVAA